MPTPITRGAASALSFGFLSVSKTHWITFGTATFLSVSSKLDASLNLVNVTYKGLETPIYKIGNDGILGYNARKYSTGSSGYETSAIDVDTSTGYTWTAGLFSTPSTYFGLVAAYDSSNNLALIKRVNNVAYAPYTDIKVSGSNIVVCGDYLDTGTFTYGVHVGVLTKSTGLYSLSRILTSATELYSRAVTVDGSGNIYALGTTFATATYICKYNSSMVLQWQTQMSSTNPSDITTDSSGDVYVCASNSVQKFNSSGTLQWQRTIATGVAYRSVAFSKLTIDSSNNIYAVGTMTDTQSTTYYYAVIVKYNSSGTLQWTRVLYKSSDSNPQVFGKAISIDNTNGNFYISGQDTGGSFPYLLTAKLPIDGTLTGSYSQASPAVTYTYADPGWTDAAGAFTQTTPTFTDAAGTTAQATPTSPSSQNLSNPFYKLPV